MNEENISLSASNADAMNKEISTASLAEPLRAHKDTKKETKHYVSAPPLGRIAEKL